MKKKIVIPLIVVVSTLLFVTIFLLSKYFIAKYRDKSAIEDLSLIEDFTLLPPPPMIYGFIEDSFYVEQDIVKRNENLASILLSRNVDYSVIQLLANNCKPLFDVKRIRAGNNYTFLYNLPTNSDLLEKPAYFIYEIDNIDFLIMELNDSGIVTRLQKPIEIIRTIGAGEISSSLWNAMKENELNPMLAVQLSDIYAWTVDFFGIEKGDYFRVIFDEIFVEGNSVGIKTIHAALFNHRGKEFFAFQYEQDTIWGFFDENGQSLRKAFLKAPLNFSRISSRFSHSRYHPILKISRPHHGVDYAAPEGTPVYAIGDGHIIEKAWDSKGGGNYLKIKHNSVYTSVYMHLSGFAKGLNKGSSVRQGDLIGYVGKTGLATGPHLDFRIFKNGSPVDPLKVDAPPVEPIKEAEMEDFLKFIAPLNEELCKEVNLQEPD
ncbi:MAG: peptidoglycan DD-metalloendopeptidase family protein [Marinilabiliaceae bacterium]|nr:peptidoglycan DD-metalloendopeptidase family protein [Marinilabiliaceae bacterium]